MLETIIVNEKNASKNKNYFDRLIRKVSQEDPSIMQKHGNYFMPPSEKSISIILVNKETDPKTGKKTEEILGLSRAKITEENVAVSKWIYVFPKGRGKLVGNLLESKRFVHLKEKGIMNFTYTVDLEGKKMATIRDFLWNEKNLQLGVNSKTKEIKIFNNNLKSLNEYFSHKAIENLGEMKEKVMKGRTIKGKEILKAPQMKRLLTLEKSPFIKRKNPLRPIKKKVLKRKRR